MSRCTTANHIPWMGGCAPCSVLPFSSFMNDGGFASLLWRNLDVIISTSSSSRSTHLTHPHCFISIAHKSHLCNFVSSPTPRLLHIPIIIMNLSTASLLLLTTIPNALSANTVCHLFMLLLISCVRSKSRMEKPSYHQCLDCHCSGARRWRRSHCNMLLTGHRRLICVSVLIPVGHQSLPPVNDTTSCCNCNMLLISLSCVQRVGGQLSCCLYTSYRWSVYDRADLYVAHFSIHIICTLSEEIAHSPRHWNTLTSYESNTF